MDDISQQNIQLLHNKRMIQPQNYAWIKYGSHATHWTINDFSEMPDQHAPQNFKLGNLIFIVHIYTLRPQSKPH